MTAGEPIARILLESVAEKTGYPVDMLELDMQLDVDLGIDSIKRVEILSAVQDRLPMPGRSAPSNSGSLSTLRQIADFWLVRPRHGSGSRERRLRRFRANAATDRDEPDPQTGASSSTETAGTAESRHGNGMAAATPVSDQALSAEPTARAPDRRDEVGFAAGGTVWITDDGSPLAEAVRATADGARLRRRGDRLDEARPPERERAALRLDRAGAQRRGRSRRSSPRRFRMMRAAGAGTRRIGRAGRGVVLDRLAAGRIVRPGRALRGSVSPISGALAGLAKTAAREWPARQLQGDRPRRGVRRARGAARVDRRRISETRSDEVGLSPAGPHGRSSSMTHRAPPSQARRRGRDLGAGDVVVISGGGRGITAEVAVAMASAVSASPGRARPIAGARPEEDWLAGIA